MASRRYTAPEPTYMGEVDADPRPKTDIIKEFMNGYPEPAVPLPEIAEDAFPTSINQDADAYETTLERTRCLLRSMAVEGDVSWAKLRHATPTSRWDTYHATRDDDLVEHYYLLD